MRIFLRALLVVLIASAAVAWASVGSVPNAVPAPTLDLQQVERADAKAALQSEKIPGETLSSSCPDLACFAACDQEREACLSGCGGNFTCIQNCNRAWRRCYRICMWC